MMKKSVKFARFLCAASLAVGATAFPASASTVNTQWMAGYSGNEANTVLFWNFEGETNTERLSDKSDNGVNAVLRDTDNPPAVDQFASPGRFGGGALRVNKSGTGAGTGPAGVGSSVFMTNAAFMGGPASELSVEFWHKPASTGVAYLVDNKADAGHHNGIQLQRGADGALHFSLGNGTISQELETDSLAWTVDQWYHIAITFKNLGDTAQIAIWRDGEQLAGSTLGNFGDVTFRSGAFTVGDRAIYSNGTNGHAIGSGLFDEIRISDVAHTYIPEPASAALLGLGLTMFMRRRRN
ncbi:LamG-like jellyroll fold domain-containing protein [Phycisphaerales bacterium AB-hyl4]|uniref:LamG-like jellyroll fold domain-containing protein n=1 Tax=Natronomicrosphaera hydrolytica TaxID=3242702 RepID=A0ABV4U4M8_9BACT